MEADKDDIFMDNNLCKKYGGINRFLFQFIGT